MRKRTKLSSSHSEGFSLDAEKLAMLSSAVKAISDQAQVPDEITLWVKLPKNVYANLEAAITKGGKHQSVSEVLRNFLITEFGNSSEQATEPNATEAKPKRAGKKGKA